MTYDLDFWPWKKIASRLKTADQILMQFYVLITYLLT